MRRALLTTALLLLATVPATAQKKVKRPKPGAPADIVFVGNSYTQFHDLPAMVRALGRSERPWREIHTTTLAPGGCTLQKHWQTKGDKSPVRVVASERPDFVVMQEQSLMPLKDAKRMQDFAKKLAKAFKKKKAVPVWYMTWARQHQPEKQDEISKQYELAHKTNGGVLAPVGRAWQAMRKLHPEVELHAKDKSHPTKQGSYLAACVIYGAIFGGDVTQFPDKLALTTPDGKQRVLVELEPEIGKLLRAAAAEALCTPAKKQGSAKKRR